MSVCGHVELELGQLSLAVSCFCAPSGSAQTAAHACVTLEVTHRSDTLTNSTPETELAKLEVSVFAYLRELCLRREGWRSCCMI